MYSNWFLFWVDGSYLHAEKCTRDFDVEKYEYEYEYDDQIVCAEVEKSLFEKKIEKKECKAYNKQGASKRPNVEV